MAYPMPAGVSALIDPDDEASFAVLELCAEERRRLGLPSYTRDDLERLFRILDAPVCAPALAPNVIPLAPASRRRRIRR